MCRLMLYLVLFALVVSACGAVPGTVSSTPRPDTPGAMPPSIVTPSGTPTATTGGVAPVTSPLLIATPGAPSAWDAIARVAIADLAARLHMSETDIAVKQVKSVEWPDTSLGCPQPGMMYAQMVTPGYEIILTAGGKDYVYHSDRKSRVVYCPSK